tara:strand:- start:1403 stop:3289 length:1887 start_codon:yes stop_codon:yes gene_type:complete
MGRRSRPAPPPDYTPQRNALVNSTTQSYQDQANAYNTAVDEYNAEVDRISGVLSGAGSTIGGSDIASIWDDPNTTANESSLAGVDTSLTNAMNSLNNLKAPERPVFENTATSVNTGVGTVTIPGQSIPTLNEISGNPADLLNQIGGYRSDISNLNADRLAEENRVKGIYGGYLTDTANIGMDIAGYDISNDQEINDMLRNLNTMEAGQYGNSSVLLNQLDLDGDGIYGNEAAGIAGDFTDWRKSLTDLQDARNTELGRINTFGSGLYDDLDTAYTDIGGINYTSTGEIARLENLIREKEREASRFSSVLDYDFSGQQSELAALKSQLAGLRSEGAAETSRVNSFVSGQNNAYQDLYNTAMGTGIYSKAGIDALTTQLGNLNYGANNFSGWGYDAGNVGGYYKDLINPQIAALNSRRSTALDNIESGITNSTSGLADVPLYDEDAIRAYYGNINQAATALSPFSGGRADTIGNSLVAQNQQVDARIAELQQYRNTLETEAQAMMEEIEGNSYYSLDDLTDPQARANQMEKNINLYKSKQAMDEIELILEQLMGQKQRLELDAANVARRTSDAQGQLNMVDGVPQFGSNAIQPQGMGAFYNNYNTDEEEDSYTASRSPFSNSLNAITIGG